ncbi:LysR family transcriptional regulator [Orrella sp. NBD-18]|uniref:LysR family transcriptional regulator n=1 Tax=Sheuella amnicola TaxID=2707330 RepID=A0A6B2R2T0_9BURK|nr:LysR family transcriptional regulator [Sheuella amnicola]NDY81745.1 LysR family transcriptional regulator [Sheuella amnicola]
MKLDANDLILFAHLIESGSFAKTADRVGLPKSTLSRRMTQLETTLGEKLVVRTTRRLEITEFGERILEHARRLLEETEATADLAQHEQGQPRGLLRVSMPPDFIDLDLTQVLIRFASQYPEVRLELDLSPRRVDLVAERFDLALRVASKLPDDALLIARKLADMTTHLYASPAYLKRHGTPIVPTDLDDHICLRMISSGGEPVPWRLSSPKQATWEGMPTGPLSSNSPGLQRELAKHGLGVVGLADHFATKLVEQGILVRVLPDWSLPRVTIWCMTPGKRLLPQRTLAFIELLKDALGN